MIPGVDFDIFEVRRKSLRGRKVDGVEFGVGDAVVEDERTAIGVKTSSFETILMLRQASLASSAVFTLSSSLKLDSDSIDPNSKMEDDEDSSSLQMLAV